MMSPFFSKIFALLVVFIALFQGSSVGQTADVIKEIDLIMTTSYPADKPGAALLVAQGDKIIFKKGYGKASLEDGSTITPQHVFRVGSITKQFTSAAILKLVSEGKIGLDDKVIKYLPEYKPQGESITIRHLLNHTSGIPNYTGLLELKSPQNKSATKTIEERFADFNKLPLEFAPGEKFQYSNSGYFVLGMIIEKVSRLKYGEYLEKNFFKPLNMTSSFYDGSTVHSPKTAIGYTMENNNLKEAPFIHHSMPFAAGALASTVEDLWKWSRALFTYKVVPREVMEKAWQSNKLNDRTKFSYGYGWSLARLDELKVVDHGGAIDGFVGYVVNIPERDFFVSILTNTEDYGLISNIYRIARLALHKPIINPEVITIDDELLEDYVGSYSIDKNRFRVISKQGNQIFSDDGFSGPEEMLPSKKDGFFIKDTPAILEFERDQNNRISAIKFSGYAWEDTREPRVLSSVSQQKQAIVLDPLKFDEYVGEYEIAAGFIVKVWRDNERFMTEATGMGSHEIFPESEQSFFLKGTDASLEFLRESNSVVTGVVVKMGSKTNKAKKIK